MKSFTELALNPKWKLYFPERNIGIARGKLNATKHRQLARVVFSTFNGMDVLQLSFKKNFAPTPMEIDEVMPMFFKPEEIDQCLVTPHPDNEKITVIYRVQDESEQV